MCGEPGLSDLVVGQRVGDVAGQRELLDAGGQRRVRRRLDRAGVVLAARRGGGHGRGDLGGGVGRGVTGVDRVGEQVDPVVLLRLDLLLPAALAQLAVAEDRAVVGGVAHLGVDVVVQHRAAARAHRLGGLVVLGLGGRGAAQGLVAQLGEPGRDLVDGRRGDDEDAEDRQQRQQRHDDVRRLHEVEQQARGDVADGAAGLLEVGGVAEHRLRVAVGDVHDAEQPEREGGPPDDLAAGGTVALGVAQGAPAGVDEEQRHEPADLADRARRHRAGEVHDPAGQLPPHGGGDDHGEAEEEQADAVAAVLGVEVAGGLPDRPRDRADGVGDAEPHGCDTSPEHAEAARDRTGAVADGTGRRARARTTCGRAGAAPALR